MSKQGNLTALDVFTQAVKKIKNGKQDMNVALANADKVQIVISKDAECNAIGYATNFSLETAKDGNVVLVLYPQEMTTPENFLKG